MALNSPRVGDLATHRRAVGPLAARRLDALVEGLPGSGSWRPLEDLTGEPDGSVETLVTAAALCGVGDIDAAVTEVRRLLVPGGRLVFLEHGARPGGLVALRRAVATAYTRLPGGCVTSHDVPAALRRAGFVIDRLDRIVLPGASPLVRRWVRGVARSRP